MVAGAAGDSFGDGRGHLIRDCIDLSRVRRTPGRSCRDRPDAQGYQVWTWRPTTLGRAPSSSMNTNQVDQSIPPYSGLSSGSWTAIHTKLARAGETAADGPTPPAPIGTPPGSNWTSPSW